MWPPSALSWFPRPRAPPSTPRLPQQEEGEAAGCHLRPPDDVAIGETLEIRGKHFIRGRYQNTVVFKRDRGRAVFVKAKVGTTKLLRVSVPKKLEKEFAKVGGVAVPTRFRVRVLTKQLGKRFTKLTRSPVIAPSPRPRRRATRAPPRRRL